MQAFSVRQLKSNPSAVLRAAQGDAMALVTSHQHPMALVVALDRLGLPDTAAVRSGSLSVAAAAQGAGITLPRFLELLASLQIPVAGGDVAELQNDLAVARRWLRQSDSNA
jgi:antitoxin (DNA-binding transcriptional repressor) of toxin-antitoxin stability system